MTSVCDLPAAFDDNVVLPLAANGFGAFELALAEVSGGICAGGVDDVGQSVGAKLCKSFAGQGVLVETFLELLCTGFECLGIGRLGSLSAAWINDDYLYSLAPHHGTQTAASTVSRGSAFDVGYRDAGGRGSHFAGLANAQAGDFVAKLLELLGDRVVVAKPDESVGLLDFDAFGVYHQAIHFTLLGLSLQHNALDPEGCQSDRAHAAGIAFLDRSGQGAFRSHRQTARAWGSRAG